MNQPTFSNDSMLENTLIPRKPKERTALRRLHKWWHRAHRVSRRGGAGLYWYRLSISLLSWLCGRKSIQRLFFTVQIALLEQFLSQNTITVANLAQMKRLYLTQETLRTFKYLTVLKGFSLSEIQQLTVLEGWEHFQQPYANGQGVLLIGSHYGLQRTLWMYLDRLGIAVTSIAVGRRPRLHTLGMAASAANKALMSARDVKTAHRVLSTGGVVGIAADGRTGREDIALPFLQRTRRFKVGFAKIAAMTGAAVIPVECMLDASGRICVRFFPALHGCSDASQTMVLVEQYVAHLEQMWCSAPENIATKRLRDYLYGSREYIVSP